MVKRTAWLSITPEPERELPAAVATLRSGAAPSDGEVAEEAGRIALLITRSRQRQGVRYLHGVLALAGGGGGATCMVCGPCPRPAPTAPIHWCGAPPTAPPPSCPTTTTCCWP